MTSFSAMTSSYPHPAQKPSPTLWQIAQQLRQHTQHPSRLAPLVLMSDPERLPDPSRAIRQLPEKSAFIYRHFGAANRHTQAFTLRRLCHQKHIQFLIANDPELAADCHADGVHFSRRSRSEIIHQSRQKHPNWLISQAAPKPLPLTNRLHLLPLDALFVSSIFASQSPGAGTPVGTAKLTKLCQYMALPIFALGGVNLKTAPHLIHSGVAGIATVSGLTPENNPV